MLLTYIREEELYHLGGRDRGRVFYCEWKTSAPLTDLVLGCITSLRCRQDSLPGTVVGHSLNKSMLSIHICPEGMPRNVPLRPWLETSPFLLRFSGAIFFSGYPTTSVFLPSLSFLPPLAEWEVSDHILFHAQIFSFEFFFLTLSFKRLDFLNEAFESYQHGPFKNRDVKPFGVIVLAGGPWRTEEFLTSTNKPFSLNSTLWINLFYLMVNVACATQTLVIVRRVCVTAAPGQDAIRKQN